MFDSQLFDHILEFMSNHEGEIISSARIEEELISRDDIPTTAEDKLDIDHAVKDLITLGELTVHTIQQHARVFYTPSVDPEAFAEEPTENFVWQAYIAEGYRTRRLSALFETKPAAVDFLYAGAGSVADELQRVDGLNWVYAGQYGGYGTGDLTVVLRCQPVLETLELGCQSSADTNDDSLEVNDETKLLVYHLIKDGITGTTSLSETAAEPEGEVNEQALRNLTTAVLKEVDNISTDGEFTGSWGERMNLHEGVKTKIHQSDLTLTADQRDRIATNVIDFALSTWSQ